MVMPRVIPGWVEALKLMPAGSKWEVVIPQELGYGSQNMGQIKPFSTLIFTIEVLK
jgi:FKBP-type peptidyl-prolyl cis-trans isomerase FklB